MQSANQTSRTNAPASSTGKLQGKEKDRRDTCFLMGKNKLLSTDAHLSGKTTMTSKEVMTIKVRMGLLRRGGANIGVDRGAPGVLRNKKGIFFIIIHPTIHLFFVIF